MNMCNCKMCNLELIKIDFVVSVLILDSEKRDGMLGDCLCRSNFLPIHYYSHFIEISTNKALACQFYWLGT